VLKFSTGANGTGGVWGHPTRGRRPTAPSNIYLSIAAGGWGRAFAEYRPKMAARKPNATVRDLLTEIRATADISPNIIQDYARDIFRKIIADMIGLDDNPKKFDIAPVVIRSGSGRSRA
jgi:hypothetical protein